MLPPVSYHFRCESLRAKNSSGSVNGNRHDARFAARRTSVTLPLQLGGAPPNPPKFQRVAQLELSEVRKSGIVRLERCARSLRIQPSERCLGPGAQRSLSRRGHSGLVRIAASRRQRTMQVARGKEGRTNNSTDSDGGTTGGGAVNMACAGLRTKKWRGETQATERMQGHRVVFG